MAVRAVIFDWGGTLTPWHVVDHDSLWRSVCAPHFPAERVAEIAAAMRGQKGRPLKGDGHLQKMAVVALPFALTASPVRALDEIRADMAAGSRMLRLLQGDVGSGKTVVAFLAMLTAVESGAQAALMAPTELLARQHMATIAPLAQAAGVPVALLTGREKSKAREEVLEGLSSGRIGMAIGTHALFQEGVAFADLALARGDGRYPRLMRALGGVKLLILDDWGLEPLGPEQRHDLVLLHAQPDVEQDVGIPVVAVQILDLEQAHCATASCTPPR